LTLTPHLEAVEENVTIRWKALQKAIAEEKKHHKNGIIGSLTGRGDKKEGQRVGRKSTEVAKREARQSQSRARASTVEAPNDKPGRLDPKVLDLCNARRSVEGNARGGAMNRMSSAPITSLEHGEHYHRDKLQLPVVTARHQPAAQKAPDEGDTKELGRPHLGDKGRDKSDPQLASPTSEQQPASMSEQPSIADTQDDGPGRPSPDGSDSTRVGTEPTHWVAVRQKAEGLAQERGPGEVGI
jgi:hypothetical protein